MTSRAATPNHYAWLLDELSRALGPDVARGTLDGSLSLLAIDPVHAGDDEYRALLRGPLRERLRLNLGTRASNALVERLERERFGPEQPTPTKMGPPTLTTMVAPHLGRRATDLALSLAELRAGIARRGLEFARREGAARGLNLAAEQALDLAETEARRFATRQALEKLRGQHLRREIWEEAALARERVKLLSRLLNDATQRQETGTATEAELTRLRFELRAARDLSEGLDALNLPEAPPNPTHEPVVTDAGAWLARADRHHSVQRARHAFESAEFRVMALREAGIAPLELDAAQGEFTRAAVALTAAREAAFVEVRARLELLRQHEQAVVAGRESHRAAEEALARLARDHAQKLVSELTLLQARVEVSARLAAWRGARFRLSEAALELRLLLGGVDPDEGAPS